MTSIKVAILDVGQGDTIIVHTEGPRREAVIIDCINAIKVRDYLRENNIGRVQALIVTHLHADHYSQARIFLEQARDWFPDSPAQIIFRGLPEKRYADTVFKGNADSKSLYRNLLTWAIANGDRVVTGSPRPNPFTGTFWQDIIDILQPHDGEYATLLGDDFNDTSLIIKVRGSASSILLTGDAQVAGLRMCIRNNPIKIKSDFLKVPHHGSWHAKNGTASFTEVIDAISPSLAIISVGTRQKGYGHPTDDVLTSLLMRKIPTLCTQATSKCLHCSADPVEHSCAGDIILNLSVSVNLAIEKPIKTEHTATIDRLTKGGHRCHLVL